MTSKTEYEYLIIGAGPAGLQLGYFLQKANRNYLILEAGDSAATFFQQYPRRRRLISINKVHTGYNDPEINLRWDWNSLLSDDDQLLFKHYSQKYFPATDDLVKYLNDFAEHHQLNIQYNARAKRVAKADRFTVTDEQDRTYSSQRLIVATGVSKPYLPEIPGIELAENYIDISIDPQDYVNQRVLILGKGNSAFETADILIETASVIHVASPHPITLAWKTHFVGHLRALNNNFLDTYQLKCQNAILDATIQRVQRRPDGKYIVSVSYTHANGEQEDLIYDRVLACTGFRFDSSIFDESCRPKTVIYDRFPQQTSEWESVNVKDLYFAGTLMQMRDFKKTSSGFIHGFRYNLLALHRIFESKYHGKAWKQKAIQATPESIVEAVIKRINQSSALWQQFGFLCDVIAASSGTINEVGYYEEVPIDYLQDGKLGQFDHYYTITLEFGQIKGDPFNIVRNPNPRQADQSTFLHPVVRHYRGSTLIRELHLLEDLDAEWFKQEAHIEPLLEFFRQTTSIEPVHALPFVSA
jgi:cation diffusion facilitator CzcD-associated flavoprotein CzcO